MIMLFNYITQTPGYIFYKTKKLIGERCKILKLSKIVSYIALIITVITTCVIVKPVPFLPDIK